MAYYEDTEKVMVANGHVPSWLDEKEYEELLMETGKQLLLAEQFEREEG